MHVYKKREIILLYDEVPRSVSIIKSGLVKTYNINKHGEERPVSFDAQGEIFPIGWVYGKIERTEYFYEAFTDCEIIEMPRRDFLLYMRLHPKMGYELYATLAARFVLLQSRIYALEQSRAAEKLMMTLLYLCERFAASTAGKSQIQHLRLPLTQQELANYIGITRETTSTELKKLEKLKVLKHHNQKYTIDVTALKKLINEE